MPINYYCPPLGKSSPMILSCGLSIPVKTAKLAVDPEYLHVNIMSLKVRLNVDTPYFIIESKRILRQVYNSPKLRRALAWQVVSMISKNYMNGRYLTNEFIATVVTCPRKSSVIQLLIDTTLQSTYL